MVKICSVKVSDLRNSFQIYVFQNIFFFQSVLYKCSNIKIRAFEYARKFKGAINCIGNKILANAEDFISLFHSIDNLTLILLPYLTWTSGIIILNSDKEKEMHLAI